MHKKSILLVDDSEVIRRRLVSLTSGIKGSMIIGEAENTEKAIQLFTSTNPDIVILDLSIPDEGGFHVLKKVKEHDLETVVIVLTNYSDDAYREHCYSLGADYFFDKSKDFDKVKSVLDDSM